MVEIYDLNQKHDVSKLGVDVGADDPVGLVDETETKCPLENETSDAGDGEKCISL
jgi:hypothetical protein